VYGMFTTFTAVFFGFDFVRSVGFVALTYIIKIATNSAF